MGCNRSLGKQEIIDVGWIIIRGRYMRMSREKWEDFTLVGKDVVYCRRIFQPLTSENSFSKCGVYTN